MTFIAFSYLMRLISCLPRFFPSRPMAEPRRVAPGSRRSPEVSCHHFLLRTFSLVYGHTSFCGFVAESEPRALARGLVPPLTRQALSSTPGRGVAGNDNPKIQVCCSTGFPEYVCFQPGFLTRDSPLLC